MRLRLKQVAIVAGVMFALAAAAASPASAAAIFEYNVDLFGPNNTTSVNPIGNISVGKINLALSVEVRVRHGADPPFYTQSQGAGSTSFFGSGITGMLPGDLIEVRQPSAAALPIETFTVPAISINAAVGATTVTATVPAGQISEINREGRCVDAGFGRQFPAGTGTISQQLIGPILPGESIEIGTFSSLGDATSLTSTAAGETPCVFADATTNFSPRPGEQPEPAPYSFSVSGLSGSIAPTVRFVLRRNTVELDSNTSISTFLYFDSAVKPLPGDVIELFRPAASVSPAFSYTVPNVSAVFDPSNDRVAIDGPAAAAVYAFPCRKYGCPQENARGTQSVPAGRTILDFSAPDSEGPVVDLFPSDRIYASLSTAGEFLRYTVPGIAGDLAAPIAAAKLARSIRLSALKRLLRRGLKVPVTSNEAVTAKLTLKLPKALPSKRNPRPRKSKRTQVIATVTIGLKAGTTTARLKFTRGGKRAIAQLLAAGGKAATQSATLTVVLTDPSGNAATVTKTSKFKY